MSISKAGSHHILDSDPTTTTDAALLQEFVRALALDLGGLLDHVRIADERLQPSVGFPYESAPSPSGPLDEVAMALARAKSASGELIAHLETAYDAASRMIER